MADFRSKLLGLAAVATAFAGVSYGQTVACPAGGIVPTGNPTLRAESTTELVADVTSTCTLTGAATTGTVILTLSLPVTSKAVTYPAALATNGNSDAVLVVTPTGLPAVTYFGVVSGTQVSFSNVAFPANFTMTSSNIRVNASTGGAPQVTETILVSFATGGTTSNIVSAAQNVGFILSTLGATSLLGSPPAINSYTTCVGNPISTLAAGALSPTNTSFTVVIRELVAGAFRTQAQEGGTYTVQPAGVTAVGTATTGTQVQMVLGNVPASATVYVPIAVTVNATTLTINNATPVTSPNAVAVGFGAGNAAAFTPVSNVVTVVYTTTAAASSQASNFNIPVVVGFAANSAAAQTAMTVLTSYAPAAAATAPATAVPNFLPTTATPVNGSIISLCQTSLLFPFVTNQQGFDTGIVLANTSTDNLSTIPGTTSVAKPQAGTCTLSFYGAGAPTPSTGINDPQGNSPTAGVHAFLLSQVAPGFQGYAIASCPFLYAHGFAFLASGLGSPGGVVQGYLAEVLSPGRPTSITAITSVQGAAGGGAVTSTSTTTAGLPETTTF
jgi:hypothetical protein